ncbi:GspE/PulE family protein [Candidatus Gracilibacteria bacterium]|nr:GspE/PulE family protein [Candidatus Gracilibacteria bacterium]
MTTKASTKQKKTDDLKESILASEEKRNYTSERFDLLEKQVKKALKQQDTDTALRDMTTGALILGCSDVHYDMYHDHIMVRFRIDGILVDIFSLTLGEYKLILERLKYASNLKLNISNIPQDGKYSLKIEDKNIDVRVSTLPIKYGENIVCRILDTSKVMIDFEKLGFFWTSERMLNKAISKKNGMILVTGPTGSGKTTTLYTILTKLNTRDKKLITLEDPIEYEVEGLIQSEIDESKKYDFPTGLKALLRQDPDIMMVGEIRDSETLETATTASLTGHLVLSTLHTKSAAETLDRLMNMGLKPYMMASALDTIIAQRLVRRICPHCKREKQKTESEQSLIGAMVEETGMNKMLVKNMKLYEGAGCKHCNHSGYLGRIGLYEIISLNENLREAIREGATADEILKQARKTDMIPMQEDGILKAIKGYTTIEEVLRVL